MRKAIVSLTINRLLSPKKWLFLLALTGVLVVLQEYSMREMHYAEHVTNPFVFIIGYHSMAKGTQLYLLAFALMATLFGADLYAQDRKEGYLFFNLVRLSKQSYFSALAVAAFVAGAIATAFPYLIHSMLVFWRYPFRAPSLYDHTLVITPLNPAFDLFMNHPLGFWAMYALFYALFGGIMALFGLALSVAVPVRFIEYLGPWLIAISLKYFGYFIFSEKPYDLIFLDGLQFSAANKYTLIMVVLNAVFFVGLSLVLIVRRGRRDVY